MNKIDRLQAVIAGEKPDRLPVALWRHWPGDDQNAQALAAAHLKWQHDYDWDFVKVGPSSSYSVDDWGAKTRWLGHIEGTREWGQRVIREPEDWASLKPLDPGRGMLAEQVEALRLVKKGMANDVPVIATIFSPLSQAKHLAGSELLISHLRSLPQAVHAGLRAINESTLRFIEAARQAGISGIYYAVQHARYPVMSRAEFSEFGRAYDLPILEAANDLWLNVLHVHSTDIMFDLVSDYPVSVVNWHDRDTLPLLADGLTQIGGAASGGVSQWSLHEENPDRALAEAAEAVRATNGRRLILGTGCVIMVTTPTRNIRALREYVENG